MCGIFVSTSCDPSIIKETKKLINRGPDDYAVKKVTDSIFAFRRLAIMDLNKTGMQPFENKGNYLIANAEIYNYMQIKKELSHFSFSSTSDCEVLLPLYDQLGVDMFEYLDGEFAIILYDQTLGEIIAARDPIGIRPLFYGYSTLDNKIVLASEAKALITVVKKVYPFPPGHYYYRGSFIKYHKLYPINQYHKSMFHDVVEEIRVKLSNAITKRLDSDAPMGFLLSGGLDSSIVCAVASRILKKPIKTFSIGMKEDPIDLKYAKVVADYLHTDHTEVLISKEDVVNTLDELIYHLESFDITTIRASMGMFLLAKYIHQHTDIKVIHTGEVSDELFGYKYTDFAPNPEAFQEESVKRVHELYKYDVLRADRCLAANSLEARVPFADTDFAGYVLRISPILKMNNYRIGKFLLRKAFEGDYLPRDILYREKAAFSDAVGHSLVDYLKEYAESVYSDEEFNREKERYTPLPFTKEALLYRDIFEKYYKNHEHLIKDYWMPNKSWKGCDVDDPSARVLSNYGTSGD